MCIHLTYILLFIIQIPQKVNTMAIIPSRLVASKRNTESTTEIKLRDLHIFQKVGIFDNSKPMDT